eukprot:4590567-Pyramimonas_sp.AAC.1
MLVVQSPAMLVVRGQATMFVVLSPASTNLLAKPVPQDDVPSGPPSIVYFVWRAADRKVSDPTSTTSH